MWGVIGNYGVLLGAEFTENFWGNGEFASPEGIVWSVDVGDEREIGVICLFDIVFLI